MAGTRDLRQRDRLTERQSQASDLVVIEPLNEFTCTGCGGPGRT